MPRTFNDVFLGERSHIALQHSQGAQTGADMSAVGLVNADGREFKA
jgi:hypothetical protein